MKYIRLALPVLSVAIFASCNWFKQKTKDTVNKSGEIVATAGSEFAKGVKQGIEKSFQSEVSFSPELTKAGLKAGKLTINSTDSTTDNILTAYLIFDEPFDRLVTVRVFTEKGQEYGRVSLQLKAQKGEARYVDFVFDKRTNIESRGKISFE